MHSARRNQFCCKWHLAMPAVNVSKCRHSSAVCVPTWLPFHLIYKNPLGNTLYLVEYYRVDSTGGLNIGRVIVYSRLCAGLYLASDRENRGNVS